MRVKLTRRQMTDLCAKNYLEIEVGEATEQKGIQRDGPYINQALLVTCNDIEVYGIVTKVKEERSKITFEFDKVSEIKAEWFSVVRRMNEIDRQSANLLIHMILGRLCRNGEWEEVDELIALIKPETDDIDIMLSFLVATHTTEAKGLLKNRARFYDNAESRMRPVVWTVGVMDNLK